MRSQKPVVLAANAAIASCLLLLSIVGCSSNVELLTSSEEDSLTKLRSGKYTMVENEELTKLKSEAEIGKSVGRYRVDREGFRTWRLDTATEKTCILLTSEEDWKKPETSLQSCSSE
jgi:hypothetical protein